MDKHKFIPMWILIKCINFSTFIDFVSCSTEEVKTSLCKLYGLYDERCFPDFKFLIGSLHWMRTIRNACAHNERVYTMCREKKYAGRRHSTGRIHCSYFKLLPSAYLADKEQRTVDLLIYLKYYLSSEDYGNLISEIEKALIELQKRIPPIAFDNVRGQLGIKDMRDLDLLLSSSKCIEYNKF